MLNELIKKYQSDLDMYAQLDGMNAYIHMNECARFVEDLKGLKEKMTIRKNALVKREEEKKDINKLYVMEIADIIDELIGKD